MHWQAASMFRRYFSSMSSFWLLRRLSWDSSNFYSSIYLICCEFSTSVLFLSSIVFFRAFTIFSRVLWNIVLILKASSGFWHAGRSCYELCSVRIERTSSRSLLSWMSIMSVLSDCFRFCCMDPSSCFTYSYSLLSIFSKLSIFCSTSLNRWSQPSPNPITSISNFSS